MFKCDKCEYETKRKGDLTKHINGKHNKIKNYKCSKCVNVFGCNTNLKHHIKTIHDKIKDFKCNKCVFICSNKGELKRHSNQIHDNIKKFKCTICEHMSFSKSHMKRHMKKVHERPIMDKHMSLGEYAIYDYLTKNNIQFEKEMKFKDLVSPKNKPLRYDFYIKSHNLLIEFDGKQHFEKVRWTKEHTDNEINERYNFLVECDHLKNEYADANKIKLYRIKYTDIKNIDNILKVLLI